jgi:hypothetical protein
MTSIRTRLDKLEAQLKPDSEPSVWEGIINFLTKEELFSMYDAHEAGAPLPVEELVRLWLLGHERGNCGMRAQDVEDVYGKSRHLVKANFCRFLHELREKIGAENVPHEERFDTRRLLDIHVDRFSQLLQTGSSDSFEASADAIERLWLDDKRMSVAEFENLVRPCGVAGHTLP